MSAVINLQKTSLSTFRGYFDAGNAYLQDKRGFCNSHARLQDVKWLNCPRCRATELPVGQQSSGEQTLETGFIHKFPAE